MTNAGEMMTRREIWIPTLSLNIVTKRKREGTKRQGRRDVEKRSKTLSAVKGQGVYVLNLRALMQSMDPFLNS
jgi:hypothetical protein